MPLGLAVYTPVQRGRQRTIEGLKSARMESPRWKKTRINDNYLGVWCWRGVELFGQAGRRAGSCRRAIGVDPVVIDASCIVAMRVCVNRAGR